MRRVRHKQHGATLATLLASSLVAAPAHAGLVLKTTALWPASPDGSTSIALCWRQGGYERESLIILNAIRRTWGAVARIDVSNAGLCGGVASGNIVPVNIAPSGSTSSDAHTSAVGKDGEIFMTLSSPVVVDRLRYLAIHEFGHVLGFQHEQDSPLADPACTTSNACGNVTQFGGTWDRASAGRWSVNLPDATQQIQWGTTGDIPIPGDYFGEGRARPAVYRPSSRCFLFPMRLPSALSNSACFPSALPGDVPVKGRYTGQLQEEPMLFRPSNGTFITRGGAHNNRGPANSQPVF